eukprot:11204308-Lingulodinium_polyedra.AAC.1
MRRRPRRCTLTLGAVAYYASSLLARDGRVTFETYCATTPLRKDTRAWLNDPHRSLRRARAPQRS